MIHYLWPVLWMGLIFFLSTDAGSSSNTFNLLEPTLRVLFPQMTQHTMLLMNSILRKLAHVMEYAILSYLWLRAFRQGKQDWSPRWALWALAISVSYAMLDEYHQRFVTARTSSLADVGIDSLGVLMTQVYLFIVLRQPLPEPESGKKTGRSE
ncbi:MAG: VanZ family protein [Nitrospirae bacterium]|nr:VanZ family protein [Nitrospirota bacterium]